jgi:hypothetical protein
MGFVHDDGGRGSSSGWEGAQCAKGHELTTGKWFHNGFPDYLAGTDAATREEFWISSMKSVNSRNFHESLLMDSQKTAMVFMPKGEHHDENTTRRTSAKMDPAF